MVSVQVTTKGSMESEGNFDTFNDSHIRQDIGKKKHKGKKNSKRNDEVLIELI